MSFPPNRYIDIVIVGSDLSELTSSYHLHRLGLKCIIYEVTDIIGRRTHFLSLQNEENSPMEEPGYFSVTSLLGLACEIKFYPFLPSIKLFGGNMYHILRHPIFFFSLVSRPSLP